MDVVLIIRILRHYVVGAMLLLFQAGLACAAIMLSLTVINDSRARLSINSAVDESRVGMVHVVDLSDKATHRERQQLDLAALAQVPGVRAVAVADSAPFGGRSSMFGLCTSAAAMDEAVQAGSIDIDGCHQPTVISVSPNWMLAMGLRIVQGRDFSLDEFENTPSAVVVSQQMALRLFPHGSALGGRVHMGPDQVMTVVGVAEDAPRPSPVGDKDDYEWVLMPSWPQGSQSYYILGLSEPWTISMQDMVLNALYQVEAYRVIDSEGVGTVASYRELFLGEDRFKFRALLFCIVAVLVILMVGVTGLAGAWVNRRKRTIGIRRALGARRRDILAYFLTENLLLSVTGALMGLAVAIALTYLPGVGALSQWDGATAIVAVLLVVAANICAALLPSLRAVRQEPVALLRSR